jgi:hypothetical protein
LSAQNLGPAHATALQALEPFGQHVDGDVIVALDQLVDVLFAFERGRSARERPAVPNDPSGIVDWGVAKGTASR